MGIPNLFSLDLRMFEMVHANLRFLKMPIEPKP